MKRFLALLTALACTLSPAVADNPKADAKAVVTSGNARFTVLTPQLIRMEWSADGQFEDRATLTFVNRETPVPEFKVRESKSKLTITTPALTLTYLKNGKFSDKNLKAVFTLNGREVVWTPGMENPQNLLGTTRTLDGADGSKLKGADGAGNPLPRGLVPDRRFAASCADARRFRMGRVGRSASRRRPSGPLPLRLRTRLQTGAGRLRARRRPRADASEIYAGLLVEPLLAVFGQRIRRSGEQTRSRWTCRSTC